jgi:hypothetical protein
MRDGAIGNRLALRMLLDQLHTHQRGPGGPSPFIGMPQEFLEGGGTLGDHVLGPQGKHYSLIRQEQRPTH